MLIASYNPAEMGDILVTITAPNNGDQTSTIKDGVVQIVSAKDQQLLGYNFMDASKLLPELTKENGQVFLTDDQVAKLNQKLTQAAVNSFAGIV